jgi:hypothetical protein
VLCSSCDCSHSPPQTGHLIHTWEVKGISKMYCQFKLLQTGQGSNGTDEYFMCNGEHFFLASPLFRSC